VDHFYHSLFIYFIKIYAIVTFIAVRQITTMTACSVERCKNRSEDGIIFKSIPKNPYKRSIWTKHMNRTPPKNGRICADHFSEDQWESTEEACCTFYFRLSEVLIKFKHRRKNVCCVTG
jgi:hypothetical protein